MKILAVITARGGSKRIPGKNIRPLGGIPLITWTINAAKRHPEICDILVTTDDLMIAGIARAEGVCVPWIRPAELASDTSNSVDVCLHALDWYERENGVVDGLLLLQPTSPFRSWSTISKGIALFLKSSGNAVVSLSPAVSNPHWCYRVIGDSATPIMNHGVKIERTQDLPPVFVLNGMLYLITPDQLRSERTFTPKDMQPLIVEKLWEGLDIDLPWDWFIAEKVAEYLLLDKEIG